MVDIVLHQNDEGIDITLTIEEDGVAVDLSTATTKQLKFKKPGEVGVTVNGVFVTDGTDGKLKYTTGAAFLTPAGRWKVQAYIVIGSQKWHTQVADFFVREALA